VTTRGDRPSRESARLDYLAGFGPQTENPRIGVQLPWSKKSFLFLIIRVCPNSAQIRSGKSASNAPLGELEANPAEVLAGIEPAGFSHLSIIGEHPAKVVELPPIHKDPFDRMLVAQAWVEPMILLTDDDRLGGYGDFIEVV
jgi:hypothetical protein